MSKNAIRETEVPEEHLCLMHLDEIRSEHEEVRRNINELLVFLVIIIFIVATLGYLVLNNIRIEPLDSIYLEMSIFLFTVIVGFTVARQNNRYRQIMEQITEFDGSVSTIYRECAHFGESYQERFKAIAINHYEPIIRRHEWDYNILNKSSTLTLTYALIKEALEDKSIAHIEHSSVSEIKKELSGMQKNRKDMIALHAERIPRFQWFVMVFISIMLVLTITAVSSYGLMVESMLKASFVTAIIATMIMVKRLDTLDLFESFLGEHSAQDVIDIFDGKK